MPIDEEAENAVPLSGMNEELLTKAENMGENRVGSVGGRAEK